MTYLEQFRSAIILKLIIISFISYAQVDFRLSVEERNMSKGEQISYMIDIPQADLKSVKKNWIKLLQEETKEKAIVTDHEIFIEGAIIKEIVQKPINVYSYVYEVDSIIRIYSFFEVDSVFFEYSGPENDIVGEKMYNGITNFKRKFATEQYIITVKDEMELEEKTLKILLGDLKKLEKENENLHKEIKENEQHITESNEELNMLDADNERQIKSISSQREELATISDSDQKKIAKKELKNLENEKKKIGNKIEKEYKKIVEYQASITKCESDIDKNLMLQEEMKKEIETQEALIKAVTAKLDGIK